MNEAPAGPTEWYEFPCTPVQERFWETAKRAPGSSSLNIGLRWRINGPVDGHMIDRAFRHLMRRHESLRTAFDESGGRLTQRVLPIAPLNVPVVDLRLLSPRDREQEFERICEEDARTPFDLTAAPLLRVKLVPFGDQDAFLLVTLHHLIADGWSIGILEREIGAICDALIAGSAPTLPPLPIQYSDYAVWHREWLASDLLRGEREFWAKRLENFRAFDVPPDRPRPSVAKPATKIVSLLLTSELKAEVERLARTHRATWFMTSVTALALVLAKRAQESDLSIGTQVAGRDQVESEGVIGPFVNRLLLRMDLSGVRSFADALQRVGTAISGALEHSRTPFEHLVDLAKVRHDPGRHPLFTVNVVQLSFDVVRCSNLTIQSVPSVSVDAIFDLNFFFVERPAVGWRASCEFNTELFDESTVLGFLKELVSLLARAAADPNRPLPDEFTRPLPRPAHRPMPTGDLSPTPPPRELVDDSRRRLVNRRAGMMRGLAICADRLLDRCDRATSALRGWVRSVDHEGPGGEPVTEARKDLAEAAVITLQPKGSATPIIAIHNVLTFHNLARCLGLARPFHCIMPDEGLFGRSGLSYHDVVAHYVQGIRSVQAHGPYVLLGHCFAARIAYEAAQQLIDAGETIACLIVIDAWAPGHRLRRSYAGLQLFKASYHLVRWSWRIRKLVFGQVGWRVISWRIRRTLGREPPPNQKEVARIDWVDAKLRRHAVRTYGGRLLVVRALGEPHGLLLEDDLAWGELATGGLERRDVSGTHHTIFQEPEVRDLAVAIMNMLDRTDGPVPDVLPQSRSKPV